MHGRNFFCICPIIVYYWKHCTDASCQNCNSLCKANKDSIYLFFRIVFHCVRQINILSIYLSIYLTLLRLVVECCALAYIYVYMLLCSSLCHKYECSLVPNYPVCINVINLLTSAYRYMCSSATAVKHLLLSCRHCIVQTQKSIFKPVCTCYLWMSDPTQARVTMSVARMTKLPTLCCCCCRFIWKQNLVSQLVRTNRQFLFHCLQFSSLFFNF